MTRPSFAIVADSSASLPAGFADREGIIIVPISTIFDGETVLDGELSPAQFYRRLEATSGRPATTSPEPREFVEAFRAARDSGAQQVLCLIMSSRLSATFKVAETATTLARNELDIDARVVDTRGLAMTHGFAVIAATEARNAGASIEETEEVAVRVGSTGELVGALDSVRFLARGGRVPRLVHWATSALQIKPVLAWSDGKVRTVARPRTMAKAFDRVVEYAQGRAGGAQLRVAAMHSGSPAFAAELADLAREHLGVREVLISEFSAAMGVHTGPGFAGLAFYPE